MQGFNMGRYVPPEYEGTTSANKLAGKHALGNRARKANQGILTVRFEMPFAIWCTTCPKPTIIGQGVRFNAEKKKVGNYFSTPIYSFRMKHTPCGGWIEIRTDPQNTAYVVTEGAKKRDTGEDKVLDGEIIIRTDDEKERLANDAFAALEGKVQDRKQAETHRTRIEELEKLSDRHWDDPFEVNKRLRNTFRVERKLRQHKEQVTEDLKDKMSLGIDLLDETEEDRIRAGFVEFGEIDPENAIRRARSRPLFSGTGSDSGRDNKPPDGKRKRLSPEELCKERREKMGLEFSNNTRAAIDPFLVSKGGKSESGGISLGIKRKRLQDTPGPNTVTESDSKAAVNDTTSSNSKQVLALVDYESD
ncbi:MAG: hypothetical protein M1834_008529 [Cirrosporium novae-zelandiae]|nr:MAG: hypothetical protein M1834_008529 [Cirrosporium novae-zelandiae]